MSANESTTRGYGRIDDETHKRTPILLRTIKELVCDAKDAIEYAIYEAKEAAEERRLEREERKRAGDVESDSNHTLFGSIEDDLDYSERDDR